MERLLNQNSYIITPDLSPLQKKKSQLHEKMEVCVCVWGGAER